MSAGAEIAAGIASGLGGLIQTGYNIYAGNRDFDYQKALQQEIFNREDNAVQRRMADLKAAGLNPNLAAGSAAGAGAVVGRSNTPQISGNPIGTALDTASAVAQLRAQREQNEILKNQRDETAAKARLAENDALMSNIEFNTMLGLKSYLSYNSDGRLQVSHSGVGEGYKHLTQENAPFMNYLKWAWQNSKNSADLLQKDVDWYTSDKIADYFGIGARIFSGVGSGMYSFGKWNKYYR